MESTTPNLVPLEALPAEPKATPDAKRPRRAARWLTVAAAALGVATTVTTLGWSHIAVAVAPKKQATQQRSVQALAADELFWTTLHGGHYDGIQSALERETAAYLATPNDAVTAAHVGWLHVWRVAERARLGSSPATITDDIVLSHKYFQEAAALEPAEARFRGFLATQMLSEAHVDRDERLTREGYYVLRQAVKDWPEFNLFTAGYIMSDLPVESPRFKEGLEQQWENMDVCAGEHVDRAHPDYAKYLPLDTKTGQKRACWNSWIAPHNLEGFFLNMGDMLVRTGDVATARAIYADAKASRDYETWRFQDVLEARIAQADANVSAFNHPQVGSTPIMLKSEFACMGCHQQ